MELSEISAAYAVSARRMDPQRTSVRLIPIEDIAGSIVQQYFHDLREVVPDDDESALQDFLQSVRALRWVLLSDPVPIAVNEFGSIHLENLRRLLPSILSITSTQTQLTASRLVELIAEVEKSPRLPFSSALLDELTMLDDDVTIVVPRPRQCEPLERWLDRERGRRIEVIPAALASSEAGQFRETLICLGPPEIYKAKGRTALTQLVAGPGSELISFMYPDWSRKPQGMLPIALLDSPLSSLTSSSTPFFAKSEPVLLEQNPFVTSLDRPSLPDETQELAEDDWDLRDREVGRGGHGAPVECVRLELARGFFAFVEDGADRVRTIQIIDGRIQSVRLERISNLNVGELISLRIDASEPSELRKRAISILGSDAGQAVVKSQSEWKTRLLDFGERNGWRELDLDLSRRGMKVVGQERRWADPLSVRPRNDGDFMILLTHLGYSSNDSQIIIERSTAFMRAIMQAAREITSQLEQALKEASVKEICAGLELPIFEEGRLVRSVFVGPICEIDPVRRPVASSQVRVALGGSQ